MVPADWAVWDYMAGRRAGRFNYEVEVFLKLMIHHDCSLNRKSVFDDPIPPMKNESKRRDSTQRNYERRSQNQVVDGTAGKKCEFRFI